MNAKLLTVGFLIMAMLNACKKDSAKPAVAPAATASQPTITQQLAGKWFVVKDSIQTLDYRTPVANPAPKLVFGPNDYVIFNKDSTATVSSDLAFDAFDMDFNSNNVDGKLTVNSVTDPNLNFKYKIDSAYTTSPLSGPAITVYSLSMQNFNPFIASGYSLTRPTPTTLILYHQLLIPVVAHEYVINQYVYLSR